MHFAAYDIHREQPRGDRDPLGRVRYQAMAGLSHAGSSLIQADRILMRDRELKSNTYSSLGRPVWRGASFRGAAYSVPSEVSIGTSLSGRQGES